jgi:hypothetical protein
MTDANITLEEIEQRGHRSRSGVDRADSAEDARRLIRATGRGTVLGWMNH